jgi:hypothetical protein
VRGRYRHDGEIRFPAGREHVGAPAFLPRDDGGDGPRVPRHSRGPAGWNRLTASTADYWNPPTSEGQHAQQRILAVILGFVLAAILAHAGW